MDIIPDFNNAMAYLMKLGFIGSFQERRVIEMWIEEYVSDHIDSSDIISAKMWNEDPNQYHQ